MTVVKTATSTPANGTAYVEGEVITYSITVTNDGNVDYHNVVVSDELTGMTETIPTLAVGATQTFDTVYTVTAADAAAGSVLNAVTAQADPIDPEDPNPNPPTGGDTEEVPTEPSAQPNALLNVRYWMDGAVFNTFSATYAVGSAYDVASPLVDGYDADQLRVAGTLNADTTIDVYYTRHIYTLTIRYRFVGGGVAAPTYTANLEYGASYSIASPTIAGYTTERPRVRGTMPNRDVEITVYYDTTATPPDLITIDDYGTPLGLGNLSINAGDSIE